MKDDNKSRVINEYLSKVARPELDELLHIRRLVSNLVPDAEEVITYGIPGFKYKGEYLIGYAALKGHLSIYPTPEPIVALKDKLTGFQLSKGAIRFSVDNNLSDELLVEIVTLRMKIIDKDF